VSPESYQVASSQHHERGQRNVSVVNLYWIAEALGMGPSALFAEANSASTTSLRHERLVRSIACLYASTGPIPF
jgi:transcriptional regulator with XRE-family HTH domain